MGKWRLLASEFGWRLSRLALVGYLTVFAGCAIGRKEAQFPPLVRAERRLARAEKIRSDPQERAAELLSVARTAASELPNISAETNINADQSIRIYNRAARDLAADLPQLTRGR